MNTMYFIDYILGATWKPIIKTWKSGKNMKTGIRHKNETTTCKTRPNMIARRIEWHHLKITSWSSHWWYHYQWYHGSAMMNSLNNTDNVTCTNSPFICYPRFLWRCATLFMHILDFYEDVPHNYTHPHFLWRCTSLSMYIVYTGWCRHSFKIFIYSHTPYFSVRRGAS